MQHEIDHLNGVTMFDRAVEKELFDEFNVFISSMIIGGKSTPTIAGGEGVADNHKPLKLLRVENVNNCIKWILGRVAQRESTVLTSQGSLVQSQPCPPLLSDT